MKPPFHLIEDATSEETVQCLRLLLHKAERGEIIGLAYAAMHKKRGYSVNACGEAHRSPTYSRGMLLALDDKLSTRVRGES